MSRGALTLVSNIGLALAMGFVVLWYLGLPYAIWAAGYCMVVWILGTLAARTHDD